MIDRADRDQAEPPTGAERSLAHTTCCNCLHLNEKLWRNEIRADRRPSGTMILEALRVGTIVYFVVVETRQEDGCGYHVVEAEIARFQNRFDVRDDLLCLREEIISTNQPSVIVNCDLSGGHDQIIGPYTMGIRCLWSRQSIRLN
jgi:hypothetical protein